MQLTDDGMVRGLDIANISLADFERKIKDESIPKTNFTQLISNEAHPTIIAMIETRNSMTPNHRH